MKGYNKPALAQAAAERLRAAGYAVIVLCRSGWYVLDIAANDNKPSGSVTA